MTSAGKQPAVAIVVPLYREALRADEELSLRHLERYLAGYDRILLCPETLSVSRRVHAEPSHVDTRRFADRHFQSVDSYSRLLLSEAFYRSFESYDFILIYQLDALVFSDQLHHWCAAGHDYVGAPWLVDPHSPEKGFSRVGNGGFSLRRVGAFLRVLTTPGRPTWGSLAGAPLPDVGTGRWLQRLRILRQARRGVANYTRDYTLNEDRFWSDRATLFDEDFQIARPEEAVAFSFEQAPRYCFQRTGGHLPFGCHAWGRWDRSFWRPFLLD